MTTIDDDHRPLAVLSRRRLLTVAGLGAAAVAGTTLVPSGAGAADGSSRSTAAAASSCSTDSPEQELGPFYVADGLVRSDVTAGEDGVPLTLALTLLDSTTCGPLVGAAVDIWQANALGVYSDESSENTVGETYLRGIQLTDSAGKVTFTTIVPGWYSGRAMHVHLRVYTGGTVSGSSYSYTGATLVHTGQLFFDDTTSAAVASVAPYTSNPTQRTLNSADRPYTQQGGDEEVLALSGSTSTGYTGTLTVTVTGNGSSTGTGGGSGGGSGSGTSTADASSLTIKASSNHTQAGTRIVLSGVLKDTATGKGLADQDITLTAALPGGTTHAIVLETDHAGGWTYGLAPSTTATYRVGYLGTTAHAAARSSSVAVAVDYRLVLSHISGTASHNRAITASGVVAPGRKGTVVTVHAITSTGSVRTLVRTATDADGRWTARWHMARGRHRIVATVAGDKYDRAATSRTVVVTRT